MQEAKGGSKDELTGVHPATLQEPHLSHKSILLPTMPTITSLCIRLFSGANDIFRKSAHHHSGVVLVLVSGAGLIK